MPVARWTPIRGLLEGACTAGFASAGAHLVLELAPGAGDARLLLGLRLVRAPGTLLAVRLANTVLRRARRAFVAPDLVGPRGEPTSRAVFALAIRSARRVLRLRRTRCTYRHSITLGVARVLVEALAHCA